jgi:hypothetical protein
MSHALSSRSPPQGVVGAPMSHALLTGCREPQWGRWRPLPVCQREAFPIKRNAITVLSLGNYVTQTSVFHQQSISFNL